MAAEAADREVAQADRHGRKKSGPVKRARLAWAQAERAFLIAEQRERAWQRARAALEFFRPDGRRNDRAWAAAEIAAAVRELPGEPGTSARARGAATARTSTWACACRRTTPGP